MAPVRRVLSIVLLIGFSLPLIAPLFASAAAEASLPACCRRNGKHHCAMTGMMGQSPSPYRTVAEKCPCAPFAGLALMLPHAFAPRGAANPAGWSVASAALVREAEAGYRISAERTRQKRGPPSLLSL
jgi:hypothetical protein